MTLEYIETAVSGTFINQRTSLPDGTYLVACVGVLWGVA